MKPHRDNLPSPLEIESCIAIMRRIRTSDLPSLDPNFTIEGHALFEKSIKLKCFGDQSVVDFLKQKSDYQAMIRKLSYIYDEVQATHVNLVEVN